MSSEAGGFRPRRVVPVVHRFSDDVRVVSVEIRDDGVVFGLGMAEELSAPFPWDRWLVTDDAGTSYADVSGYGGGSPQQGYRYDIKFWPTPPPEATSLRIRDEATGGDLSISLTD